MQKLLSIIVVLLLSLTLTACSHASQKPEKDLPQKVSAMVNRLMHPKSPISYTATFAIFTHGTFRVFTASMYHNLSPNIYIESSTPNTIQVKKPGTTWGDFFSTLPLSLTQNCLTTGTGQTFCTSSDNTLNFFLNGTKVDNPLSTQINDGDRLLISFGPNNNPNVSVELDTLQNL